MEDEESTTQDTETENNNDYQSDTSDRKKKSNMFPVVVFVLLLIVGGILFLKNSKSDNSTDNPTNSPLAESTENSASGLKTYSLDEVTKHSTKEDCWLVIEGGVYDVTAFAPKHPGEEAIFFGCGKDATEMFNKRPKDGTSHSDRARVQLEKLKIGTLSSS